MRPLLLALLVGLARSAAAPAVPFSGLYGGTAGAGSALGWDRLAAGANPAALGRPGMSLSLAGYSPYGLAGLRMLEAGVARDAPRWGASATYQNWIDGGRLLSAEAEAQAAVRLGGAGAGLSLAWHRVTEEEGSNAFAAGAGVLWRPPFPGRVLGVGAQTRLESGQPLLAAFGADLGGRLWTGATGPANLRSRLAGEMFRVDGAWEARYGAALHLHASLAIHAGWVPRRRSAALGVRFGAAGWEGFSAMRRHAALGGTAIQGLRWRRLASQGHGEGEESEDAKGERP